MAVRKVVVINNGQIEQLQLGDIVDAFALFGFDILSKSVTGDDSNSVSSTGNPIPGLTFSLLANTRYKVEGFLVIDNSLAAAGSKLRAIIPTLSTIALTVESLNTSDTSRLTRYITANNSFSASLSPFVSNKCWCKITGEIATAATAGDFILQHAPITNGQTTVLISLGSSLSVIPKLT